MSARYDGAAFGAHRDDLIQMLFDRFNMKCIVQYWPLNRTELFARLGFADAEGPETNRFFDNMISFPWWSDMPDSLLDDMAARTAEALVAIRKG